MIKKHVKHTGDIVNALVLCGMDFYEAVQLVEKIPDAEHVVHGEWIKLDECDYQCSECGFRFTSADPISKFEYCRCGARMKGAKDE